MGFLSTIMVMNDTLYAIEADPLRFGKEAIKAILEMGCSEGSIDFGPGQNTLISCHHSSVVAVIAVGGGCATVLGYVPEGRHIQEDEQIDLLKCLADKHGFRLVRKSVKRG